MKVKAIEVANFRNLERFAMEFKPFTVIIGENNIGKTNLLSAIRLVLGSDFRISYRRRLEIDDISCSAVRAFKQQVADPGIAPGDVEFPEVSVRLALEGFDEDQQAVVGDWFTNAELSEASLTYAFRYRSSKRDEWIADQRARVASLSKMDGEEDESCDERVVDAVDFPIKDYDYAVFGGNDPTTQADTYWTRMLGFELLGALRDSNRELVASDRGRLLHHVLASRDEGKFADLKAALSSLANKVENNEELGKITEAISDQLQLLSLHPDDGDSVVRFLFAHPETAELLKRFTLVYAQSPVDVMRNGLGRNNLLYIALVLSHLFDDDNTSNKRVFRFVGIEEPEAHLHPDLQEHLAKRIQAQTTDATQIVLTTHSAHIASKMPLENMAILHRDDDSNLVAHYVLEGFGTTAADRRSKAYLGKYLDATRSTMFFSRFLILVEGISEQLVIPKLFERHFGRQCSAHRCVVLNVQGLAFKHFLAVIRNGYFIKCAVLTDSDTGTKLENRAAQLTKEYADCPAVEIFESAEPTFEKDLAACNREGGGRKTLAAALYKTRPQAGKKYLAEAKGAPLDVEAFYTLVQDHKAEFAYNLAGLLAIVGSQITIPDYVKRAFEHLGEECGSE